MKAIDLQTLAGLLVIGLGAAFIIGYESGAKAVSDQRDRIEAGTRHYAMDDRLRKLEEGDAKPTPCGCKKHKHTEAA